MADGNNQLLTLIIIIIAILIVVWLLFSFNDDKQHHHEHRDEDKRPGFNARPDPVGGVETKSETTGQVEISWDAAENAVKYKVFISKCRHKRRSHQNYKRPVANSRVVVGNGSHCPGCDGKSNNCCPQKCFSCVSQFDYDEVLETTQTRIVVKTCEPCICFIIVPYNGNNEAGISDRGCDGTKIVWKCPPCCDKVLIFVDGCEIAKVPCEDQMFVVKDLSCGECAEIAIACKSKCGVGERNVVLECKSSSCSDSSSSSSSCSESKSSGRRYRRHKKHGSKSSSSCSDSKHSHRRSRYGKK